MISSSEPVGSLYVHVPFCARKCEYCAFYSEASNGARIERYVAALVRELELVACRVRPRTVFFGGGTPSLLNLKQWEVVFRAMDRLGLLGAEEWTIECNPATVSLDKARLWRSYGVNRVSMGIQSLDEKLLDRLGRVHSRDMAHRSFDILRKGGFANINLDLMFAIPGQTRVVWGKTLDEALAMGSEHLSSYEVIYEEDTPLYEQLQAGEFSVDEDLACEMYEDLVERAGASGFGQYEVANFARRGMEDPTFEPCLACRHNINYWRGGDYLGLGPSASGYEGGVRSVNWSNTDLYCERLERGVRAGASEERLSALERAGEIAAFGLRMNGGWPFAEFRKVTGHEFEVLWEAEMTELVGRGWGLTETDRFRLSPAGLRFADAAAEMFLVVPERGSGSCGGHPGGQPNVAGVMD